LADGISVICGCVLLVKNTNKGGAAKKLNRSAPFGSCLFGKMKDESDDEK
jgi:hypothetical protein